jgi:hypothetical protein
LTRVALDVAIRQGLLPHRHLSGWLMYQDAVHNRQRIEIEPGPGNYGYYQVVEQWNSMLDDQEAAEWGAPLVQRLLGLVDQLDDRDDTMAVYGTPEWSEIIRKRGPAESAWQIRCEKCGLNNIGFSTSGFLDEYYVVNYQARVVAWQSLYPDGAPDHDEGVCAECGAQLPEKVWGSVFSALKGYTVVRK